MTIFGANETAPRDGADRSSLGVENQRAMAVARIAIGVTQGLVLYLLYRTTEDQGIGRAMIWPATVPGLFGPLMLVALYLPVVLLAGVGRLRPMTLAVWAGIAAVVLGLLGWHDVVRQAVGNGPDEAPYLDLPLFPFAAVALFIAHHLIVPADQERRWIASFAAYFDTAWKAGVQLALSIGFTVAFWLLLFLGAALFNVIGLRFLGDLIQEPWFAIPVTTLTFAVAVHLTDVRDGLIRGVRSVALMLLSWLLLVMTVLVAGFMAALPFTGLDGLWATGSATALVLAAAGALIVLINTAYQDGRPENAPPAVLKIAVRVAALLLTPLVVLAIWGLALRIGQYGLTPDRIIAAACAVVGGIYAVGYGYAALPVHRAGWMQPLERTNVGAAVATVATILVLFSPLADPARLSVADQMARLERGAVSPEAFDYRFLRFESGRVGEKALARLAASSDAAVATRAKEAQAAESRYEIEPPSVLSQVVIEAYPAGTALPQGFAVPVMSSDIRATCDTAGKCLAQSLDMNGDGQVEVLLANPWMLMLFQQADGAWVEVGTVDLARCGGPRQDPRETMRSGGLRPVPSPWADLEVAGVVNPINRSADCERAQAVAKPPVAAPAPPR
ncbi:DUF4153 domain-containing protein [Brevundimonas vitis]|uniref:DUF4153 domain-containing protein n=1 Tax=Brevundimonas vitisensis TaxID=2800818 RepID=A0ABX7BS38_9CAUL|nr:DUF4153 domain-containing protein [Brevundimonas vitisensis]QQQ18315.1 DUF4153 domain-containing protein [Brevundimonas vitisensis]